MVVLRALVLLLFVVYSSCKYVHLHLNRFHRRTTEVKTEKQGVVALFFRCSKKNKALIFAAALGAVRPRRRAADSEDFDPREPVQKNVHVLFKTLLFWAIIKLCQTSFLLPLSL